jgi:hypothetical protein
MASHPGRIERRAVVATHGHCFDGAASAAIFTRLLSHLEGDRSLSFAYRACGYGPSQSVVDSSWLDGDVNAVLDFRYTQSPRLAWYFDHHRTAFQGEGDLEHFRARAPGTGFHDASYGSCAKLVADVATARFGFHDPRLDELVRWADIIDSAGFESAEQAVARREPELQLMTVLEHDGDAACLQRLVPRLASLPVTEVAMLPEVRQRWEVLGRLQAAFVERVGRASVPMGRVVYVDLTDEVTEVVGKFVTYAQFPDSLYSVVASRARAKCKVSIGFNPWAKGERTHDISAICARYGGGGHAVVGAVSLPPDAVERTREVALEIARELER